VQKKKIHKTQKVAKFNPEDLPTAFFENIIDDLAMEHFEADHTVGQMASSAINSAIELSKLVIENRVRNTEHMIDEDIYNIYRKSFTAILEAASGAND
jgi:hypothetical protein